MISPAVEAERLVARVVVEVGLAQHMLLLAAVAQDAHEPLRDDGAQRRTEEEAFDAEIEQARHGGGRGLGVQRRQHQMAGERRMDRDVRRLGDRGFRRP